MTWADNDKLGVFTRDNGTTSNAEFTVPGMEISLDGKTASFEGELTISDPDQQTEVYGYYPYNNTSGSTPKTIPIDLGSQTQTGTTDQEGLAHLAAKDYMAATPVTKMFDNGNLFLSFEFNPLLTIMSFEIKQAMVVKSIKLEAVGATNPTPFYTAGTVDITTDNKTFPITGGGTAQSSVELSVAEGTITANATGMFNMMIFPIAADKMPTTLKAIVTTTDGVVYTQIKNVPEEGFARGKRYIMELGALKSNKWGGTYPAAKADAAYSGGGGTEADPYLLASAEDFAQFAANGEKHSKGKFFHLTTDINLADNSWTPITTFLGNFDGKGHTISNLNVKLESGSAGLFAYIGGTATIANLHIDGTVETSDKGNLVVNYAGGICGNSGGTSCTISGCSFSGSVTGSVSGGICGAIPDDYSYSHKLTITACRNTGSVTGKSSSGGILGRSGVRATANITACYNEGKIAFSGDPFKDTMLGGIMTSGSSGTATVTACYNAYEDATFPNIVFGRSDKITVKECYAVSKNAYDDENDQKATIFSAEAWPIAADAWTASSTADGSTKYWKSLGEKGTTKYPKLWWEKE